MTIDQLFTTEIQYVGDGVQATFPVPFPFFEAADVRVVLRDGEIETPLYYGTDFTVQAAPPLGGEVRLAQAPAAGVSVFVFLDIPATQLLNLHNQGRLPAEELEKALDKLTMILAQLNARLARALLIPLGTGNPDEWFANYDGWITATLENAQNTAGMAQQVLDQAETALGSAGAAQVQAEQALTTATAAMAIVNTAAGEVVAAKNAAESAALEASAIFSKLLGLRVVVVFLTGGATPSGSYDPETGVLTIRIFVPTEGGGGGSDVTVSDSMNGTGTAAEGVAASEWALAQVNTKATGAQGAAAAAQTKADAAYGLAEGIDVPDFPTPTLADKGKALVVLPDGTIGFSEVGGLPLLTPFWSSLGLPEAGCLNLSLDNGRIAYDTFPVQVWDKINLAHTENTGAVTTEAAWLAEVALHGTCGRYALGEDFFRVPLLRKEASFGFPDPVAGAGHGDFLPDQIGPIEAARSNYIASSTAQGLTASNASSGLVGFGIANGSNYGRAAGGDTLDIVRGVSHGNDTHGNIVIYTPMLKMYGSIDDPGVLNAANVVQMITSKLDASRFEVSQQVMHVQDQKPSGASGGTFTSGAWRTRDLNTVVANTIPGASLANNQVTLPAGVYDIIAFAPAYKAGGHIVCLYSITENALLALGVMEYTGAAYGVSTTSCLTTRITLPVSTILELRHQCSSTQAGNGFGADVNLVGVPSCFSNVFIRRVA